MSLMDYLDENLSRAVGNVRESAVKIWAAPKHKYYTDHTVAHSERIIAKLNGLTAGVMHSEKPMSKHELYILLAAIFLHDIGMQNECFEGGDLEKIREVHEKITYEMIMNSIKDSKRYGTLGLILDPSLVVAVARVAEGHRKSDLTSRKYDLFKFGDEIIRPRLLASFLRLGDALDIDHRRVIMENLELTRISAGSRYHWFRCHYVNGVTVEDEFITIGYRLPPEKNYDALIVPLVEDEIRNELSKLEGILRKFGAKPGLAEPEIQFNELVKAMPKDVLDCAKEELQKQSERRKKISEDFLAVDELAREVTFWIQLMGFEVTRQHRTGEWCVDLTAEKEQDLFFQHLLVRCVDGEVDVARVKSFESVLAKEDISSGWIVSHKRVARTARDYVLKKRKLEVFTLAEIIHKIFEPYFEYLMKFVEDSPIACYYVDLSCEKPVFSEEGKEIDRDFYPVLDDYIDDWLSERGKNHISILGEFGTGKTWFCAHYAYRQLKRWLDNPTDCRIPLLIRLRDYARSGDIRQLVTDLLVNRYKIRMVGSYEAFDKLNRDGRLLLLFDGFDEMATRVDHKTTLANFEALAQTAVPGSKVLLTCRTPYFCTGGEERSILTGENPVEIVAKRPNFEILYLCQFSPEQIKRVLELRTPDCWEEYWQRIKDTYDLPNLAQRPVMLDMIITILPELEGLESIDHAMLYKTYTNRWIEKAITEGRTLLDADSKRFFTQEVAWEMFKRRELTLHFDRIRKLVERYLEPKLERPEDILFLEQDVRTASFISKRDESGNYEFMHRSFMEFFVAQKLAQTIREGNSTPLGEQEVYYEIIRFINQMIDPDRDIPTMIAWWENPSNKEALRANCIRMSGNWVRPEVLSKLIALVGKAEELSSLRRDAIRSIIRILHGEEVDWTERHVRQTLHAFAIRTNRDKLIVERLPIQVKLLHKHLVPKERLFLHDRYIKQAAELLFDCLSTDKQEEIRLNASYALIHFVRKGMIPRLVEIAKTDDSLYVRFNCCTGLLAAKSPHVRDIFKDLLSRSNDPEFVKLGRANLEASQT